MNLPAAYPVPCPAETKHLPEKICVTVPGSKSITNRALLLATLAEGTSTLRGALFSDDSRHFLKCVQELGFQACADENASLITVKGEGGQIPKKEASIYVGSAGTAARFLTAYLGVSHGTYHLDASPQMRRRPMAPLLDGLRELGCEIECELEPDHFPFTLRSKGFSKHDTTVNIDNSSQYLSALLISSCLSPEDFTISVEGSHGMAYIEMTSRMMAQFGVNAQVTEEGTPEAGKTFHTPSGQHYTPLDYQIEPDISGACYFYAMCPLLNLPVQVRNVHFDSLQGDTQFLHILEQLGCRSRDLPEGVLLLPPETGHYPGLTVDMGSCSDQAITMAALAPFADGPTTITGIGHIRFQECDRLQAIVNELSGLGIRCEYTDTSVTIYPGTVSPGTVNTYDDHRMAMGFTLIGLRTPGIVISDPGCCRKTFENYYEVLEDALCISS